MNKGNNENKVLKILVKEPDKEPYIKEIEHSLEAMQEIVGGYIESVEMPGMRNVDLYVNEEGKNVPMVMGCYGIGVSRTLQSIVEQYHDDFGIKWPLNVAPYHAVIVPINYNDEVWNKWINYNLNMIDEQLNFQAF